MEPTDMESASQVPRVLDVVPPGKKYSVIASLPKNSTSLAVQAEEAGVDAVMLNVDGEDSGYPGHYGSYDLHDVYINDVISTVNLPCGLSVGGAKALTEEYWERIMASRFSFVEMYAHQMPLFILEDQRVQKVVAVSAGYVIEQVRQISLMDGVEAIDAATVPQQLRTQPFSVFDYATVGLLAGLSQKPLLLRTQKRMTRADVAKVVELGVRGLVVDPCILSGTDEAYRHELASLSPGRQDSG